VSAHLSRFRVVALLLSLVFAIACGDDDDADTRDASMQFDAGGRADASTSPERDASEAVDAGDSSVPIQCVDVEARWRALLDRSDSCEVNQDCTAIDELSCECASGVQVALARAAHSEVLDFLNSHRGCPDESGQPWPGVSCDYPPLRNLRCSNHRCTADYNAYCSTPDAGNDEDGGDDGG
jgi:hypothetical protein